VTERIVEQKILQALPVEFAKLAPIALYKGCGLANLRLIVA
jgi:hypothetical protein